MLCRLPAAVHTNPTNDQPFVCHRETRWFVTHKRLCEMEQESRPALTLALSPPHHPPQLSHSHRETRWFVTYKRRREVEEHTLPAVIQELTGQAQCPFGDAGGRGGRIGSAFGPSTSFCWAQLFWGDAGGWFGLGFCPWPLVLLISLTGAAPLWGRRWVQGGGHLLICARG